MSTKVGFIPKNLLLLTIAVLMYTAILPHSVEGQALVEFMETELVVSEAEMTVDVCVVVVQGVITVNSTFTLTSGSTDDSATSCIDYVPFDNLTRTFPPGQTDFCEPFFVRQDGDLEGTETVKVTLSSNDLNLGNQTTITISILDSGRITVGFSPSSYTVVEGGSPTSVCAARMSGSLSRRLRLIFTPITSPSSEGNATAGLQGQDFFAGSKSVNMKAGRSQACAQFGSVDDNLSPILEDIEFYQIELTTRDNVDITPGLSVANMFIEDNDGATVSIETNTLLVTEGNTGDRNTVDICIILNDIQSGLKRNLVFTLSVNLGNASNDDIMSVDPQIITFPATAMVNDSMCAEFQIIGDDFKEVDEIFTVNVVAENRLDAISGNPQVPVTIIDDQDVVQFCESLQNPSNGVVDMPGTLEGTVATYSCNEGHILRGDKTRVCQRNANAIPGEWTGEEPTCIKGPLTLEFTDNTPFVNGTFVMANFRASKPAEFTCKMRYRRRWHTEDFITIKEDVDCHINNDSNTSGQYINYAMPTSSMKYTLIIAAKTDTESVTLQGQFRVFGIYQDNNCAVHMINTVSSPLSRANGTEFRGIVEFVVLGNPSDLTCRRNHTVVISCGEYDPQDVSTPLGTQMLKIYRMNVRQFPVGENRLIVSPEGSPPQCYFRLNMTYTFKLVDM